MAPETTALWLPLGREWEKERMSWNNFKEDFNCEYSIIPSLKTKLKHMWQDVNICLIWVMNTPGCVYYIFTCELLWNNFKDACKKDSPGYQPCHCTSNKGHKFSETLVCKLWLLSHFSRVPLCATPEMAAHQAPPSLGFSRQEHWSGLPFPSPMHEREKWKWSCSVMSDS